MVQQLVFAEPRPSRPPRHLADLDAAGRAAAVAELGLPAFRAKQLAHQYYGRLIADPRQMTDLPAVVRERVAEAMFPTLLTAVSEVTCDAGQTRKTLWRAVNDPVGATVESVLMRYPQRNTVCISSQAGCGMACPVLRDGSGRLDPQPVHRGDPGTGSCRRRGPARRLRRSAVQCGVHGHGGAAGQLRAGAGGGAAHHRAAAARFRHFGPLGDGVDGRSRPGDPQACRRTPRRDLGAVAARARRRAARHAGARSTTGGRSPRRSTPPATTPT